MEGIASYLLFASEDPYCVYTHSYGDTVFYVGSGSLGRPFQRANRNPRWHAYIKSSGQWTVTIVATFATKDVMLAYESRLIAAYQPVCNIVGNTFRGDKSWPEPEGELVLPTVEEYAAVLDALVSLQAENADLRQQCTTVWQRWCTHHLPRVISWVRRFGGTPRLPGQSTPHNSTK